MLPKHLKEVNHWGFALYGFTRTAYPIGRLYEWVVDRFTQFGCDPDLSGGSFNGKSNGRYKSFRSYDRKVRNLKFAEMTSWSLLDIPDGLPDEIHGQDMYAVYSLRAKPLSTFFVLHMREQVLGNRHSEFMEMLRQACQMLSPLYGIVYTRPFHYGPSLYGMGMMENDDPFLDDENMNKWRAMMRNEAYTLLRSVYPYNVLSSIQLNIAFNDTNLENWIRASPKRGTFSPLTDTLTLWTVPEDRIRPVRDELWQAGVILDSKRHFDDVMDEYHVNDNVVAEHYRTGIPIVKQPPGPGISEEEMLRRVLGSFGGPDSEVSKVKDGKLKPAANPAKKRPKKKS